MIANWFKEYSTTVLKGIAMGAADVVPGVSGGTIAFITGIYEKLIGSINSVNLNTLKILRKEGLTAAWKSINGTFLASLFIGIGISIVSLAKLISYLLEHHTILLWSFFFGLIVASIFYVGKAITKWSLPVVVGLLVGTIVSYWITILEPSTEPDSLSFIFFAGMVAICAMILPGISGSFILLLLGAYSTVINAIKDINIAIIGVFGLGCISGLLAFSKVLNWMFKKFHNLTIAVLTGFLIGSLNKIWPWKKTLRTGLDSHGEPIPLVQANVSPSNYELLGLGEGLLLPAIALALLGFVLIFIMERLGQQNKIKS